MRFLLIEDDELLGDGICSGLRSYGHIIDWIQDGKIARQMLTYSKEDFDVIILDLGLPRVSGLDILKDLRRRNQKTPVLILTARDGLGDKIIGLDSGADDYLAKPFDLQELSARLRALYRRSHARAKPVITYADITLDPAGHIVTYQNKLVSVSRREFSLLQKLLDNQGRVVTREQINQALYEWDEVVDSNALEVHIHNLRKQFGFDLIKTIRGIGYMIEKQEQDSSI